MNVPPTKESGKEFGARLVDRCVRGVASTDEGELLRDYIRALEVGLDQAHAEWEALREALTWIADPSYVGNYADDPNQVVEIYRKWAKSALERPE